MALFQVSLFGAKQFAGDVRSVGIVFLDVVDQMPEAKTRQDIQVLLQVFQPGRLNFNAALRQGDKTIQARRYLCVEGALGQAFNRCVDSPILDPAQFALKERTQETLRDIIADRANFLSQGIGWKGA
ncbi:hypothetical protein [Candidatus Amarolinea dominans]|uniref:hypothetical protein n=1 Tax=Candidatus Amarolinea dominans TaxID=3140696 RepID=UPI0031CCC19C